MYIPCKFGEDIFINKWYIKVHVKMWQMNGQTDRQMDGCTHANMEGIL